MCGLLLLFGFLILISKHPKREFCQRGLGCLFGIGFRCDGIGLRWAGLEVGDWRLIREC